MQRKYTEIYRYWNNNPCSGGNKGFIFQSARGLKVLEIGCGTGIDAVRFITNGAIYTGIDLTERAIGLVKAVIGNNGRAIVMNAEEIDFPDNYFDIVYSFGVIHHTINPTKVIDEAYRVLMPNGLMYVMLYNKWSYRYMIEIMVLRRILWLLHHPKYREIRKKIPHPTHHQWVSINTDTVGCPLSRVYTKKEAERLFNRFTNVKSWTENNKWFRIIIGRKPSIEL